MCIGPLSYLIQLAKKLVPRVNFGGGVSFFKVFSFVLFFLHNMKPLGTARQKLLPDVMDTFLYIRYYKIRL